MKHRLDDFTLFVGRINQKHIRVSGDPHPHPVRSWSRRAGHRRWDWD